LQVVAGWEGVSSTLGEIRDCHAETWAFFHGLFEELNLLGISLESQKRNLLQNIRSGEGKTSADTTSFDERLSQLLAQREAEREELRESREAMQKQVARLATVAVELASAQNEFQANFQVIREEISKNREALALDSSAVHVPPDSVNRELEQKLTDLERQHVLLEQDRAVLEKELEGVRNHAADLAESLAEQKRQTAQQQTQGNQELQRMRALLETIARHSCVIEPASAAADPVVPLVAKPAIAAATPADPVLGSVLAQFEMLQQDRARRRA
jgi:chromosome segregation ATPase